MPSIRHPQVAGLFYPADASDLARAVRGYLQAARPVSGAAPPKAIVAPHAGYVYSGPIAGSAYASLQAHGAGIERVLLLGPSHRVAFRGLAYTRAEAFLTPLGPVAVENAARAGLADLPQVRVFEAPFDGEHCLEVQLPFLQRVLDDFRILPFLVGEASAEEVAEVLDCLWGGSETLVVISSDLSHYLDYASAQRLDAATSRAIERLAPGEIELHQACGRTPLNGLLQAARRRGLRARTLDLRNSGDTAGPRHSVVGYGAYLFDQEPRS